MRCNVEGTTRPPPLDDDWVNDAEWGWAHRSDGWHTVAGTKLKRLKDGTFVAHSTHRPDLPVLPGPLLPDFVGHPGLPSRGVSPEDWTQTQS